MTQNVIPIGIAVILRGVNPEESHIKRDPSLTLRMTGRSAAEVSFLRMTLSFILAYL